MTETVAIEVTNARTHNLKGVSCRIPHGRVTVVTGPSGAGKSSLAFDTVFAEAQRRFVETMSPYARQFLHEMERPPVDDIANVLPAVALEAKNAVRNARSTVGTIIEVHDVLRLLFANLGEVHCPHGHGPARRFATEEVVEALRAGAASETFLVVARVPRPRRQARQARQADAALTELIRQGFARRLDGENAVRMEPGERWSASWDPLPLVLGRFRAGAEGGVALAGAIEEGLRLGGGRIEARPAAPGPRSGAAAPESVAVRYFGRELLCVSCGETLLAPTPPLFSFNSPLGACPACQGFGRIIGIDRERVIPDPERTLAERPFAPWNTPAYEELYGELYAECRRREVPLDVPWRRLPAATREWIWHGDGRGKSRFTSLDGFFAWLQQRIYRVHVRVLLSRYRAYETCPQCAGGRLRPEALAVRLAGASIGDLSRMSIEDLRAFVAALRFAPAQGALAGHLLEELRARLDVLQRVGLDYLTLDRQARTLSGGETQRIHLAAALGSGLTSTLYVLDEPTVGLHPQDSARLLELLRDLARRGNTVLVVEHDRTLIRGADHLIDLGPAAGEHGGRVVAEGTVAEVLRHPDSLTAKFLRDRPETPAREHAARFRREHRLDSALAELWARPRVEIVGARAHNLRGFDVGFPLAALVAVTGVSGSGKSTLVENVLYGTYQRSRGVVDVEPGPVDRITGLEGLADVTLVDQQPLGRSSRSNPATVLKAYDEIRKLFAATPAARARGIGAGHFSFNLELGRCSACEGTGTVEVDMHFMAPVTVPCDECQGKRFQAEVLAVTLDGRTIAETLELTVESTLAAFAGERALCRRLQPLVEVGLGYLRLGQPTSTLSGGEAQRLKLASFLSRPGGEGPRLFLFDEPTTGLHVADVDLLARTLRRLVARGDSVLVVEHNLDLIAHADWVIDLGPGGGSHGGELLWSGPLQQFLDEADGATATELRGFRSQGEAGGRDGAVALLPLAGPMQLVGGAVDS